MDNYLTTRICDCESYSNTFKMTKMVDFLRCV